MPITLANRTFEPRLFTTLLAIALIALLVSLGRWQLHRAEEKRALFSAFAAGGGTTLPIALQTPQVPRYSRVEATGRYDGTRQILIDNMVNAERAGYFVITPFALQGGGWVLVNRGWVPLGKSRADRPAIPVAGDLRSIRGRADNLPSPGIHMGVPAPLAPPYPVVAAFPTRAEVARLLKESDWTSATEMILLDAAEPDGFVRNWAPPGFPPMRHIGYAVQWFGLALTLAVIYVVTNFRRAKDRPAHPDAAP
ncbi:MAG TPA: SURF1 family protein [Steroidobacteraceae bacterium]|nr:SURF1 family protein [Steroidobacteraceae bacterium]